MRQEQFENRKKYHVRIRFVLTTCCHDEEKPCPDPEEVRNRAGASPPSLPPQQLIVCHTSFTGLHRAMDWSSHSRVGSLVRCSGADRRSWIFMCGSRTALCWHGTVLSCRTTCDNPHQGYWLDSSSGYRTILLKSIPHTMLSAYCRVCASPVSRQEPPSRLSSKSSACQLVARPFSPIQGQGGVEGTFSLFGDHAAKLEGGQVKQPGMMT